MPQVHVVDKRITLTELTTSLIRPRAKASDREAAIAAILAANPGLSAAQAVPAGTVVVIPSGIPEVQVKADPAADATDDLLARVRQGIDDLAAAAEAGENQRGESKKDLQRLLSSAAVRRLAAEQPQLSEAVDAGRADLRDGDTDARKQGARFTVAREQWIGELDELRSLFGRG